MKVKVKDEYAYYKKLVRSHYKGGKDKLTKEGCGLKLA